MIAKLIGLISLGAMMLLGAAAAHADHGNDPIEYHEGVFLLDGLAVGAIYEDSFPTEIVPNHGKLLRLTGGLYSLQSTEPIISTLWLTWFDPQLPGGQQSTAPETFEVLPGNQASVNTIVIIPFTPQRVGVHIHNEGPGEPLVVSAVLTHVTTRTAVPEPRAVALGVIGLLSVVVGRRRITARHQET
jgi:hypothetical protein